MGEVLKLNCGMCDGPSDLRHLLCRDCVEKRGGLVKEAYQAATGRSKEKWPTLFLCRIHTEQPDSLVKLLTCSCHRTEINLLLTEGLASGRIWATR